MAKKKAPTKYPLSDFIGKVDYEGGLMEALYGYGIDLNEYDIPETAEGKRFRELVAQVEPLQRELRDIFNKWSVEHPYEEEE